MIRALAKQALTSEAGWRLVSRFAPRGVRVIAYHRIVRDDEPGDGLPLTVFRAQMRWLREHCEPIELLDLEDSLADARPQRPPVLVTFDDGYRDFAENALPVLRELGIPALMFLPTAFIDAPASMMWTEELDWAFAHTTRERMVLPWDTRVSLLIGGTASRRALAARCRAFLKTQPESERAEWHARLLAALGVDPARHAPERRFLTWDEVRAARDVTTFGGHTHRHVILSRIPTGRLEDEIRRCAERIHAELGEWPSAFAYPNGGPDDFDARSRTALEGHGFRWAFTAIEGVNTVHTDPLELRRIPTGARSVADFVSLLSGLRRSAA